MFKTINPSSIIYDILQVMLVEAKPVIFGVGALIISGDKFVAVTEGKTSRRSTKIEGQLTYPMETVETFDRNDMVTIERACGLQGEEIVLDLNKTSRPLLLNTIEMKPGVVVRNYVLIIDSTNSVHQGSDPDIFDVKWVPLTEVLDVKGKLRFRPGVYETVTDYLRYRQNLKTFKIGEHSHTELADRIHPGIYDLVEQGVSGNEAVSRFLALQKP